MVDSAPGLREQRRRDTARRLTDAARRRTAEAGLASFTVDELCDEAGVSRRTFFNYFASKEDAVLGVAARRDAADLDAFFVEQRDPRIRGVSPTLVDDFVALTLGRWERMGLTPDEARAMFAALDREPRLLPRALEHLRDSENDDIALIERREGLEPGDPRASTLVHVIGALLRAAGERALTDPDAPPFPDLLRERLDAARALFG